MKVLLISGHGNDDPGIITNGYTESEVTKELVQRIHKLLEIYVDVVVYPYDRDAYQDLKNKDWQVGWNFDFVLEVHFNTGRDTGTKIYIPEKENSTSVAEVVLNNLQWFYRNLGIQKKNFLIIKTCHQKQISSALLKTCFIDNISDMEVYQKCKERISASIAAGIIEGLGARTEAQEIFLKVRNYHGISIEEALDIIDVDNSFDYRKRLAEKNDIQEYIGSRAQNAHMLHLLKYGKLKRA